jgi:GNAT superfamily N-acetyltransferase
VNTAELLARYDEQLRGSAEAEAAPADTDGPLVRVHYPRRGFVSYRSLDGLSDSEVDALIERQIAHFAALGQAFEWKQRGHDKPADLPQRLLAAGFVPEPTETVVIGEAAALAHEPVLPDGVSLRAVDDRADFERIAAMEARVWGEDWSWLTDDLTERMANESEHIDVFVAEAGGEVVSAAWLVSKPGTDFAGLWGGSTLAEWRGRGIYRALVARRAQLAVEQGARYLQVDASDDSRPILERLGFVAITTTTPFIWSPPA